MSLVIVTGGRAYADRRRVFEVMNAADAKERIGTVVVGSKYGADALATRWAEDRGRTSVVEWPDWSVGRRGGPLRNGRMIARWGAMARGVIAFPGNDGTADCVEKAEGAGLSVYRVPRRNAVSEPELV